MAVYFPNISAPYSNAAPVGDDLRADRRPFRQRRHVARDALHGHALAFEHVGLGVHVNPGVAFRVVVDGAVRDDLLRLLRAGEL